MEGPPSPLPLPQTPLIAALADARFGRFHAITLGGCTFVTIVEGFDTQVVAFVAPLMARDLLIDPVGLGLIFSAGLVGLMIGTLIFGALGDRWGRRPLVLGSLFVVGVFTLLAALSQTTTQLIVFRLLTGIGLGATLPNVIALTTEYSPRRLRPALVTLMFCGFPIGASAGALLVSTYIDAIDWRAIFVIGGVIPILLAVLLAVTLPESVHILLRDPRHRKRLLAICGRILPSGMNAAAMCDAPPVTDQQPVASSSPRLAMLFTGRMGLITLALWGGTFCNMLTAYFLVNWLPTLIAAKGVAVSSAIAATIAFNLGGITGAVLIGWVSIRFGVARTLTLVYIAATVAVALLGRADGLQAIFAMIFIAGMTVFGSLFSLNALSATCYPAAIRSTGLGFTLSVGRIGAIAGPLCGSALLAIGLPMPLIFLAAGLPALICAGAMMFLDLRVAAQTGGVEAPAALG